MDAIWCPLSNDWGNWADWATVVVTLGVGVAVGWMTNRTNALAAAANRTADAAWAAQNSAAEAAAKLREREETLILISLSGAVGLAMANLRGLKQTLDLEGYPRRLQEDARVRDIFLDRLRAAQYTIPEGIRDRLHYVDLNISGRLVRGESAIPLFIESLSHLDSCDPEIAAKAVQTFHMGLAEYVKELSVALEACQRASDAAGIRRTKAEAEAEFAGERR